MAVAAITKRFGARASVHHQRTAAPAEPPPPPPPARRRPVDRTTTLDRDAQFIGTIEVEDIAQQFDAIRAATLLADADDLFDAWRDF